MMMENVEKVLVRNGNLGFLSSDEDANYSLCLKVCIKIPYHN